MASGLFRYNGKRINEKNLINNNFRGYSLILAGRWNPIIRILIATGVECLRYVVRQGQEVLQKCNHSNYIQLAIWLELFL